MTKIKFKNVSMLCLVFFLLFSILFCSSPSLVNASEPNQENLIQNSSLAPIIQISTTEKSYVYDENENKLMYNRVTGMVFSSEGVVYNQDSQPLIYNDNTQEFEDSLKRRLDLVERSTGGLQNYYLMFGGYKVRSIGINDQLYIVGVKANTAFNSGEAYDMLISRVWVKAPWYMWLVGVTGHFEYYNLNGHKIDDKYFEQSTRSSFLLVGSGTSFMVGSFLIKFEPWGTILNLLDEIVYLMELVPPTGSPMGEFALDTVTGAFLRDNRGQKIRIKDTGQLIDPMGWPLIGADARPLWWKDDIYAYVDNKGNLLNCGENNILVDENGFIAHSVISNVIAGQRIYLIYLADETTLIPATLKTISTDPYQAEYYDMNGNKIDLNEIVEPEISVDDRQDNWPEEFPNWWENIKSFVADINNLFVSIGNFFANIVAFFIKYGSFILIGLAILFVFIIVTGLLNFLFGDKKKS